MIFARAQPRLVNIKAAIDRSSFQIPVFIAITSGDGEDHIFKTFAAARDVFDHIFSLVIDRLRQLHAVEIVERLVPVSARLRGSVDTEYVMIVHGKAVFWFSAAAARRAAGRRLLLEHARELAEAEQSPVYRLDTKAKLAKALAILIGVVVIGGSTFVAVPIVTHMMRDHEQAAARLSAQAGNAATGIAGPRATADKFFAAHQRRTSAPAADELLSVTSDVRDSVLPLSSPADDPISRRSAETPGRPLALPGKWISSTPATTGNDRKVRASARGPRTAGEIAASETHKQNVPSRLGRSRTE